MRNLSDMKSSSESDIVGPGEYAVLGLNEDVECVKRKARDATKCTAFELDTVSTATASIRHPVRDKQSHSCSTQIHKRSNIT